MSGLSQDKGTPSKGGVVAFSFPLETKKKRRFFGAPGFSNHGS